MPIAWKVKEKINLFLLLLVISQERFQGLKNYFSTMVEELRRRFFFTMQTIPNPIRRPWSTLAVKFLISGEKSVTLQNLIDLNYKELTSIHHKMKWSVQEELGKDYNPEDKDIAFTDDDSESESDYCYAPICNNCPNL